MNSLKISGLALWIGCLASAGALAAPSTHDRLTKVAEDMIHVNAMAHPIEATSLGLPGSDGDLEIPSEAARAATIVQLKNWAAQVDAIRRDAGASISLVDSDDVKLLRAEIVSDLDHLLVRQTDRKDYAGPGLAVTGAIFTGPARLPGRDGATQADLDKAWADITSRMSKAPAYIAAGQKLVTRPGRLYGVAGARQLAGAPDFFAGALTDAAKSQLAADPAAFERFVAARDALLKTFAQTTAFLNAHAPSWPENFAMGKAAYNRMLRDEQLLPYDSADLEQMARDELAHGWAEEAWLRNLSAQRHQAFGAESGGGMAPEGDALVGYYRERIEQLHGFIAAQDMLTLPPWLGTMEVVETPKVPAAGLARCVDELAAAVRQVVDEGTTSSPRRARCRRPRSAWT